MITYTRGNLLEADAEALVNTVNTVGVMGKGVALMFKEAFPENYKAYAEACQKKAVETGKMFVTERRQLVGPRWIINFPTKKHWIHPSRIEWIEQGLSDLKSVIESKHIRSIALPPLGTGNGGLEWTEVRERIEDALGSLSDVNVIVYEPTKKYQNVAKRAGVEKLTPPRALIAKLVRRYSILGIGCTLLEVQKLAWFLERSIGILGLESPLQLSFKANKFGPYDAKLPHLLNALDGSYLHCEKRIADAKPFDQITFDDSRKERVAVYLTTPEAKPFRDALEMTSRIIDGFESPLGMELLATIDWLLLKEGVSPTIESVKAGLKQWPGEPQAASRKTKLFDERLISLGLEQLRQLHAS